MQRIAVTTTRAARAGLVPRGCWETAAVDRKANFEGVDLVFGYGSLCWKPPCDESAIVETFPCVVKNFQRKFWQRSIDHRGTVESPGLVATLLSHEHPDYAKPTSSDADEDCHVLGMCYRIKNIESILPELDFREKNGYTRTVTPVFAPNGTNRCLGRAILYLAEFGNDPAYAGVIDDKVVAKIIARSSGPSGSNIQYFRSLLSFCRANSVADEHLERVEKYIQDIHSTGERPIDADGSE